MKAASSSQIYYIFTRVHCVTTCTTVHSEFGSEIPQRVSGEFVMFCHCDSFESLTLLGLFLVTMYTCLLESDTVYSGKNFLILCNTCSLHLLTPVAAESKVWVCGLSLAGIPG